MMLVNRDAGTKRLLRQSIFLWWALYFLICLPYGEHIWGKSSFNPEITVPGGPIAGTLFEVAQRVREFPHVSAGVALGLALMGLFSIAPLITGLLLAILSHGFSLAGPHVPDGGNNIASILLVYVSFFHTGEYGWSACLSRFPVIGMALNGISNVALAIARLQIAAIYMCAGIYKAGGELWQNGTALYYVLQVREYSNPFALEAVRDFPALSVLGSFTVIAFQLAFPFLVWRGRARPWLFHFGILFHLGIWVAMGLPLFALIMCFSYLAFLPGATSSRIARLLVPKGKVVAAFDSQCRICMRCARFVSRFDWARRVVIDDARNPECRAIRAVPSASRLEVMSAAVGEKGSVVSGFESVASILVRLPFFMPVRPIVALALVSGIGDLLYGLIAFSPTRRRCKEGVCELQSGGGYA